MKKYGTVSLFIFLLFLLAKAPLAQAHFLSTDGSIGVTMHIDPDDDPIANQNAIFFFDIKDKQNKFQLAQCDCQVIVQEDGQELTTQVLSKIDPSTPNFSYILPKRDVYTIQLIGTPLQPNSFQPFTLNWNLRVDRDSGGSSGSPSALVSFLAGHAIQATLILGALVGIAYQLVRNKKQVKKA